MKRYIFLMLAIVLSSINTYAQTHTFLQSLAPAGGGITILFAIILIACILALWVLLYCIVYRMAKNRQRDPAIWLVLSFIISPIAIMIVLLIAGKPTNYREEIK